MITPQDIANITMTPDKRKSSKNNYFAFYIGRPLSYVLTIPFLYTNISPNVISIISIVPCIIGFVLMGIGNSLITLLLGWGCFFLWNLMDGVDGNVARYKNLSSPMGSVYDAMSGYAATVLSFFAVGWAAAHYEGVTEFVIAFPPELYIILGGLSGIFALFPRLIMYKAITSLRDEKIALNLTEKADYGIIKVILLNITSTSGFMQVFMLLAILLNMMDYFTAFYFVLNFLVMTISLKHILLRKN